VAAASPISAARTARGPSALRGSSLAFTSSAFPTFSAANPSSTGNHGANDGASIAADARAGAGPDTREDAGVGTAEGTGEDAAAYTMVGTVLDAGTGVCAGTAADVVADAVASAGMGIRASNLPMGRDAWYAELTSVPNTLSIARGFAGPVLAVAVMIDAPPSLILGGVVAAGFSDWLDGYLVWSVDSAHLVPQRTSPHMPLPLLSHLSLLRSLSSSCVCSLQLARICPGMCCRERDRERESNEVTRHL